MNFRITLTLLACFYSLALMAQDCIAYVPIEQGTEWEITNYNAKGKSQGRIVYKLLEKSGNGGDMTFSIEMKSFDKKDEEVMSSTYDAKCEAGVFLMDMSVYMQGESFKSFQNMDVEVDATSFDLPTTNADVGTKLKDGTLVVSVDAGLNLKTTVEISDREVVNKESITTPAGSFDCVVLNQSMSTKMVVKLTLQSKEWYAEHIGMVRSETYNKNGKMIGYSELTGVSKP